MATPFGLIVQPLQNFRVMLSKCPAFQAWCEETDDDLPATEPQRSTAALAYTYFIKYGRPSGGYVYPVAIVDLPDDVNSETVATSANGMDFHNGRGMFDVTFYRVIPVELRTDDSAAWVNFCGEDDEGVKTGLGQIIEELKALSGVDTYLWIRDISLQGGPLFFNEEKKAGAKPIICAKLRFEWGIG